MARIGGRTKGTPNYPALTKILANREKLEKLLLDKALTGDVQAIQACLELLRTAPPSRKRAVARAAEQVVKETLEHEHQGG